MDSAFVIKNLIVAYSNSFKKPKLVVAAEHVPPQLVQFASSDGQLRLKLKPYTVFHEYDIPYNSNSTQTPALMDADVIVEQMKWSMNDGDTPKDGITLNVTEAVIRPRAHPLRDSLLGQTVPAKSN